MTLLFGTNYGYLYRAGWLVYNCNSELIRTKVRQGLSLQFRLEGLFYCIKEEILLF